MENTNISFIPLNDMSIKTLEINVVKEASIKFEQEVHQKIIDVFADYDKYIFNLKNIEVIDLSFIQLLLSIQKTVKSSNKKISFNIELPENLLSIIENSGFNIKKDFES
jgi:anti-anti-sigma regulatory factor